MQRTVVLLALFTGSLLAQPGPNGILFRSSTQSISAAPASPVEGSPYSATVINESIQTLADGNRIVERSTGTTARDSQGRTRNDAALPMIGGMSAATPHMAFIIDPVAQVSYTLNLDEKTAHVMNGKMMSPAFRAALPDPPPPQALSVMIAGAAPLPPSAASGPMIVSMKASKEDLAKEQAETKTEDLGTQVIEGVSAHGVRTTRTIPAGEVGNEKPIDVVTEVWTAADLKTIVSSKRSDPRTGEQTYRLTNIAQSEPDPSLFTVPADFKTIEPNAQSGNVVLYHSKE
jgi:hypothetical protein